MRPIELPSIASITNGIGYPQDLRPRYEQVPLIPPGRWNEPNGSDGVVVDTVQIRNLLDWQGAHAPVAQPVPPASLTTTAIATPHPLPSGRVLSRDNEEPPMGRLTPSDGRATAPSSARHTSANVPPAYDSAWYYSARPPPPDPYVASMSVAGEFNHDPVFLHHPYPLIDPGMSRSSASANVSSRQDRPYDRRPLPPRNECVARSASTDTYSSAPAQSAMPPPAAVIRPSRSSNIRRSLNYASRFKSSGTGPVLSGPGLPEYRAGDVQSALDAAVRRSRHDGLLFQLDRAAAAACGDGHTQVRRSTAPVPPRPPTPPALGPLYTRAPLASRAPPSTSSSSPGNRTEGY
ncbi:hypothetical protein OH76DRAFT_1484609 [Lentinus brumalis]|uniref:Uncharacterized protein n=1 Tax=Lentinus brumalis TaxID=2498619 RepID=A0A371D4N1_9APHY|nr:hypothetical protein OH76DRAFT_1484609 [Polyporus brumalis]